MQKLYTYAVTRIHFKESRLLSMQDFDVLLSAKSYAEIIRSLSDKGIGDGETLDYNLILSRETNEIWDLIAELKINMKNFTVFLLKNDFHNLKSAIKSVLTEASPKNIYLKFGTVPIKILETAIKEKNYALLPKAMQTPAEAAANVLLQTKDGQKCDLIIDQATLASIKECGESSSDKLIKEYSEITVALSNIKIALRGNRFLKSAEFIKEAMAKCETIDIDRLSHMAASSYNDMVKYISATPYGGANTAISKSYAEFEKWCDNFIMSKIAPQKSNAFTLAPIFAYVLAKETEIKNLRILLLGKANNLSNKFIKERLRDLYV